MPYTGRPFQAGRLRGDLEQGKMLTLRGHHLICLHFFSGEGYDAQFIENLRDVLKRAEDEDIEITSDADNICAKCAYLKAHKCMYDEKADEEIREMDEAALKLLNLTVGQRIRCRRKVNGRGGQQWISNFIITSPIL